MTKFVNWIKSHKFLFLVVLFFVGLLLFLTSKLSKDKAQLPLTPTIPPTSKEFKLIQTVPKEETYKSIWSTEPVTLTFNQPIKLETIKYRVSPDTKTRVLFDTKRSGTFSILPLSGWKENIKYVITIDKELTSTYGMKLNKEIIFSFTRLLPKPGDPEYPEEIEENY